MGKYFVLSIRRTKEVGVPMWFVQDEHGYTSDLTKAGRFDFELIDADRRRYDNGTSTRALDTLVITSCAEYNVQMRDVAGIVAEADKKIAELRAEVA